MKPIAKSHSPTINIQKSSREGSPCPMRVSTVYTSTDEIAKSMEFVTPSGGNMYGSQTIKTNQERNASEVTSIQVQKETDL